MRVARHNSMTILTCGRRMDRSYYRAGSLLCSLVTAMALAVASPAWAAGPFASFDGVWRGSGTVTLPEGQTEKLTCKAYYNAKDAGAGLSIALTCASASYKIELRATLVSAGSEVTGSWEERAFNSEGDITGTVSDAAMDLKVSGTLQANMKVKLESGSQSVAIATDGTGFKSVALELARN